MGRYSMQPLVLSGTESLWGRWWVAGYFGFRGVAARRDVQFLKGVLEYLEKNLKCRHKMPVAGLCVPGMVLVLWERWQVGRYSGFLSLQAPGPKSCWQGQAGNPGTVHAR